MVPPLPFVIRIGSNDRSPQLESYEPGEAFTSGVDRVVGFPCDIRSAVVRDDVSLALSSLLLCVSQCHCQPRWLHNVVHVLVRFVPQYVLPCSVATPARSSDFLIAMTK
jgi:hypothetical protein